VYVARESCYNVNVLAFLACLVGFFLP